MEIVETKNKMFFLERKLSDLKAGKIVTEKRTLNHLKDTTEWLLQEVKAIKTISEARDRVIGFWINIRPLKSN